MIIFFFAVAFAACTLGSICGMGGGVIIKPVLDFFGTYPVGTINFLSACTVLGMSSYSVGKTVLLKESVIDFRVSSLLALGAAAGGLTGKRLFSFTAGFFPNPDMAGSIQAGILFLATLITFIQTLRRKSSTKTVSGTGKSIAAGFLLGNLGAFLGIGGGPFNVALLRGSFSMTTKEAAQNSLYIIVFSQAAGMIEILLRRAVPAVAFIIPLGMILSGLLGSETGRRIGKKLSEERTTFLFEGMMVLIMLISVYNMFHLLNR